ncbi:hypothetical protein FE257_004500 [Aspergillus nanangensis]|uniref:Glucose-methanol-choline oxidoreductase C-terminal domain-containing protein n=1 Tax=Aspergillus nanangensis TaxID=2582783 RepID=A0AAD4CY82_ASPNN|nr:hypothetical protein FE257_004500 [Aspergillus nanangensis]
MREKQDSEHSSVEALCIQAAPPLSSTASVAVQLQSLANFIDCRHGYTTLKAYAGPKHYSAGIRHGNWITPRETKSAEDPSIINSSQSQVSTVNLPYSEADIRAIEEWVRRHVETTWHGIGTYAMAPREGNSVTSHGVVDERLNIYGVSNVKVADLSIAPSNVSCNTYSSALLIGEKCATLVAEDLGYSGDALKMEIPT